MPTVSKASRAGPGTVTPANASPASTSGISATAIPTLATRRDASAAAAAVRRAGLRLRLEGRGTRRRGETRHERRPELGSGRVGTAARSAFSKRATSFISLS